MRTFDTDIAAALNAGRVVKRELVEMQLGGGTLRYVRDDEPRSWDGETWQPGAFISVSAIRRESGLSASSFDVLLSASENDDLTPADLKTWYNYDWNDRKIIIRDLYLDADDGSAIDAEPLIQGYVDRVKWVQNTQTGAALQLECLDRALDFSRQNGRLATDADQKLRSATDTFFKHAAIIGEQTFWWGRKG